MCMKKKTTNYLLIIKCLLRKGKAIEHIMKPTETLSNIYRFETRKKNYRNGEMT